MASQQANPNTGTTVTPGHVIGGGFGMAFIIANSGSMTTAMRAAFVITAIGVLVLTLLAFGRAVGKDPTAKPDPGERFDRGYWRIVAVEAFALFGGLILLNHWRPSAVVGWIALVVGLHFFWLARSWTSGAREISLIAIALTVLGVAGLIIAMTADSLVAVALVSGVGSGVVLLTSSLTAALRSFLQLA